ncbi:DUF4651 domain-containing protein [Streptococcus sp. DD13]|uniref:DUF4651 domain-containing protein n=1 Tax=Streptococcus sp. DD13 TaxID=1777881 RepID=UPI000791AED3|nr:DUF4651 domain-containing protein [Streptococcus sp. DD13]KXT77904.1 hypothetical protein STRDD13_01167 [Streptococcus sp. DD13]
MKKKNKRLLGIGLAGFAGLMVGFQIVQNKLEQKKKERKILAIRAELLRKGEIAGFYILEEESSGDDLIGGAVLEDGRVFSYEMLGQALTIEEETR